MECEHYNGTGAGYKLGRQKLYLCDKCNNQLRIHILQQLIIEEEAEPMRMRVIDKMERQLEKCNCK